MKYHSFGGKKGCLLSWVSNFKLLYMPLQCIFDESEILGNVVAEQKHTRMQLFLCDLLNNVMQNEK